VKHVKSVEVCHHAKFVAIGQTVAEISQFLDFSRWRPPPSWIFIMLNF